MRESANFPTPDNNSYEHDKHLSLFKHYFCDWYDNSIAWNPYRNCIRIPVQIQIIYEMLYKFIYH